MWAPRSIFRAAWRMSSSRKSMKSAFSLRAARARLLNRFTDPLSRSISTVTFMGFSFPPASEGPGRGVAYRSIRRINRQPSNPFNGCFTTDYFFLQNDVEPNGLNGRLNLLVSQEVFNYSQLARNAKAGLLISRLPVRFRHGSPFIFFKGNHSPDPHNLQSSLIIDIEDIDILLTGFRLNPRLKNLLRVCS